MTVAVLPKRHLIKTYRILDNTDPDEYLGLSEANRALYSLIISAGIVDLSDDTTTRSVLWGMFGEGSVTRAGLESILPKYVEPLP